MKKIIDEIIGQQLSRVKSILTLVIIISVLVMAVVLFFKFTGISFPNPFRAKPIVIDKTVNVVEKINRLAELTTATYYGENVIVKKKTREATVFGMKINKIEDELVILSKGKVRVGFDLSKMQEKDIVVDSLSISLTLPQVQIFDIITNPSGFETFEESGDWSHEEVTQYKNEVRTIIEKNALESGIVELAEKAGKEKLTSFMQALGFKKVTIILNNNNNK